MRTHRPTSVKDSICIRAVNEEAQHFLEGKLDRLRERVEKSEAALNAFGRPTRLFR